MKRYYQAGRFIRSARINAGYTAMELAIMLKHKSLRYIYGVEAGDLAIPAKYLPKLSHILNISKESIIEAMMLDYRKYLEEASSESI